MVKMAPAKVVIKEKNSGDSYPEGNIENCKSWEQADLVKIIKNVFFIKHL